MPWFGESWGAPCCEDDVQIPVPVGQTCFHCTEGFDPKDRGFQEGLILRANNTPEIAYIHLECRIRLVVGSASHQLKKCSCYGGDWEDPPELTKREAARLAMEMFESGNYGQE